MTRNLIMAWHKSASRRRLAPWWMSWRDRQAASVLRRLPFGRILDVGCGGGRPMLTRYGNVYGLDNNQDLLKQALEIYVGGFWADVTDMPIRAHSVDVVYSSDVLGHIHEDKKSAAFAEMARVLRPGGISIHITENMGNNCLWKYARTKPALFWRNFIYGPGHIGLESLGTTVDRMANAGLELVEKRHFSGRLERFGHYRALLRGYGHPAYYVDCALAPVAPLLNLLLAPVFRLDARTAPKDHSSLNFLVFRKRPY